MPIKLYTARHCIPCHDVIDALNAGKYRGEEVEIIDVETDEGFVQFCRDVLDHGDGFVPVAFKDGQRCQIEIDDTNGEVVITCPVSGESSTG